MEPSRRELKAWLGNVLKSTGETPSALARRAGLASTTLTRFLNSEQGPMLETRSIAKVAQAAGATMPGIIMLTQPPGFASPDAEPFKADEKSPIDRAIAALIDGRQATDAWVLKSRALELAGYFPGDILLVDLGATAERNNVVCAQIYQPSQMRADTVFRIYEAPYLVAASSDPTLRKPVLVDNDRVVIKGVVTHSLRVAR